MRAGFPGLPPREQNARLGGEGELESETETERAAVPFTSPFGRHGGALGLGLALQLPFPAPTGRSTRLAPKGGAPVSPRMIATR